MDQEHLIAAARYFELNPVKAGLVKNAGGYEWSRARAHLTGKNDDPVMSAPLLEIINHWESLFVSGLSDEEEAEIRQHTRTGRSLGSRLFLEAVEKRRGKSVQPRNPGPERRRCVLCHRNLAPEFPDIAIFTETGNG